MSRRTWVRWLDSFSENLKSKIENPKWWGIFAIALTFVFGGVEARAQQTKKVPRIAYLAGSAGPNIPGPQVEAFRQGLRDLGYVEGKNILVEYRYAEGREDRFRELVGARLRSRDLIPRMQ